MKPFLSILLTVILTPTLVVGSPGGYACGDGEIRPHCCCPEDEFEEEAPPPTNSQWETQACCEYTPGSLAIVEHSCIENDSFFSSVAKICPENIEVIDFPSEKHITWAFFQEHPPPLFSPFLQHVRLLI